MPFSRRFPFYKCYSSKGVDEPSPDAEHTPSLSSTVLGVDALQKVGEQNRSNRTPHGCHDPTGPLNGETWRLLSAGKEVEYRSTRNALRVGKEGHDCGLCALLLDFIKLKSVDDDTEFEFLLQIFSGGEDDPAAPTDLHPINTPRLRLQARPSLRYVQYCLYATADDPTASDIATRPPLISCDSEDVYGLVMKRMNECISSHADCSKPNPVHLPTRVIDCSDPLQPRLVATDRTLSSYVALSYVWGQDTAHLTLKSNIDTYLVGIDPRVIPKTIRDAIHVTHALGMQYLWVDAFCIIQDSQDDKNNELVRMGQIYHDAYLTIIASRAPHSDAGFLQDHYVPEHYKEHPQFTVHFEDGRVGSVSIFTTGKSSYGTLEEPADGRGWCLQERLLSPRKIVYTTNFIEYHCQTDAVPVNNAIRWSVHERLNNITFNPCDADILQTVAAWTPEDWGTLQMEWVIAVSYYTRRSLSHTSDILVAFAGVAEQFFRTWGPRSGRYVAGMWENHLLSDLLWYREPWEFSYESPQARRDTAWSRDPLRPRPEVYVAPSWSWASVQGHVRVPPPVLLTSSVCEVLQCEVGLKDTRQPYGEVVSGKLKIRAPMIVGPTILCTDVNLKPISFKLYVPTDKLQELVRALPLHEGSIAVDKVPDDAMEGEEHSLPKDERGKEPILISREDVLDRSPLGIAESRYFDVDESLLLRLGSLIIAFDTPERTPPDHTHYVLLRDSGGERQGIMATDAENGSYRRIGYWQYSVMNIDASQAPWWNLGEKHTIELI